jgi:hypothetical protein
MILLGLIIIIKAVIDFFITFLPAKNTDILAKEYDLVVFGFGKFMSMAYYYLPVEQINWWVHLFFPTLLALLTIKLVADFLGLVTAGTIRLPWGK